MGFFISLAVNPNPVTDTADRQYLALDQSGFVLPSHGMAVPTDSSNQPNRGYTSGSGPGNFSVPRFSLAGLYLPGYARDVARDLVVTDWTPDKPAGYMGDSYGALWPFGDVPIAPTGETGAPFGLLPLPATQFPSIGGTTTINAIQMWSANGKPFGLGGYPDGWGYMISMDAVILNWGGPITALRQPGLDINTGNTDGVPGSSGNNCVRDWKVDPSGSGVHYVLFDSGYVYSGSGIGLPAVPVAAGVPQADGGTGTTSNPANPIGTSRRGWRWMHVEWGQYIVVVHTSGDTWGLRLQGGTEPIPPTLTPPAAHPSWWAGDQSANNFYPGYYQDGDIVPHAKPARFWQIAVSGAVRGDLLAGNVTLSAVAVTGNTTTSRPTVTWTYAESLGVPQASYNVRVYPIAVTQAAGFVAGQNAGTAWINDLSVTTASNKINVDLVNGAQYKAYVRVTSAAGVQSVWGAAGTTVTWTQNIAAPPQPTSVTATPNQGAYPGLGNVTVVATGSLPAGALRQFQRSAGGGPWTDVIGASATTASTVTDPYAPTNQSLAYLVRTFFRTPAVVASAWQLSAGVILQPATGAPPGSKLVDVFAIQGTPQYVTIHVQSSSIEGPLELRGEFDVLSGRAKTVTSGGTKGTIHTLKLMLRDGTAANNAIASILSLGRSILYQDVRGSQWWVHARPGNWKQILTNPSIDAREVDIDLVEVLTPTS